MPNWTTNAVACHKDALKVFVNDEGLVDFNLMRPMPESLHITCGGYQQEAVAAAKGTPESELREPSYPLKERLGSPLPFEVKCFDDLKRLGEVYLENERMYGHQDWYGWCCDNWGTKWNACSPSVEEHGDLAIAVFDTAWCAPSRGMFDEAFARAGFEYHAEAYDEDFNGIYSYHGACGLLFRQVHEVDDCDGERWEWDTGRFDPDVDWLKEVLGIRE